VITGRGLSNNKNLPPSRLPVIPTSLKDVTYREPRTASHLHATSTTPKSRACCSRGRRSLRLADSTTIGLAGARSATLHALAAAVVRGPTLLQAAEQLDETIQRLCRIPGVGPSTTNYITLRGLRESRMRFLRPISEFCVRSRSGRSIQRRSRSAKRPRSGDHGEPTQRYVCGRSQQLPRSKLARERIPKSRVRSRVKLARSRLGARSPSHRDTCGRRARHTAKCAVAERPRHSQGDEICVVFVVPVSADSAGPRRPFRCAGNQPCDEIWPASIELASALLLDLTFFASSRSCVVGDRPRSFSFRRGVREVTRTTLHTEISWRATRDVRRPRQTRAANLRRR
jgi:hypothetical protein